MKSWRKDLNPNPGTEVLPNFSELYCSEENVKALQRVNVSQQSFWTVSELLFYRNTPGPYLLIFHPEDVGSTFLRNIGNRL
jgi:hypothetical protein